MRSFSGLGTESSSKNLLRARLISFVRGSSLSAGYHKRRSGDQRRLTRSHTPCLFRLSARASDAWRSRVSAEVDVQEHTAVGSRVTATGLADRRPESCGPSASTA